MGWGTTPSVRSYFPKMNPSYSVRHIHPSPTFTFFNFRFYSLPLLFVNLNFNIYSQLTRYQ